MGNRHAALALGTVAIAALALVGCQEYVFEPVESAIIAVSNTTYELPDLRKADILFVIDDSGSMAGEQDNLARNFDAFINRIEQRNAERAAAGKSEVEYRIAVTSTSVDLTADDGTTRTAYYSIGDPAACQAGGYELQNGMEWPAGDFLAVPGNAAILDRAELSSDEIIRQFRQNVKLGICGSGQEQGLRAARLALEKHPDFVREDSKLLIVFVSDEEDCSDPSHTVALSTTPGYDVCAIEAQKPDGALVPVSDYVSFFQSLSPQVAVGAIASADGTWPTDMHADLCVDTACAQSCDCTAGGTATPAQEQACLDDPEKHTSPCYCGGYGPGSRYLAVAQAISDSLADSICQADFSNTLEQLAEIIVRVDRIELDARPHGDDPSLVLLKIVRPDGSAILCDSPHTGDLCTDGGVDWEYVADPKPTIKLCDNPDSQCRINPGDKYKVSFIEQACTDQTPCQ